MGRCHERGAAGAARRAGAQKTCPSRDLELEPVEPPQFGATMVVAPILQLDQCPTSLLLAPLTIYRHVLISSHAICVTTCAIPL